MKNKPIKKLLKSLVLSILFIALFIQACSPTPATSITDANETPITDGTTFSSTEPVLGTSFLHIGVSASAISITVGFDNNNNNAVETLTNISGELGSYNFQNGNIAASIRFADANSIRATVTSLKAPYFILENVLCQ